MESFQSCESEMHFRDPDVYYEIINHVAIVCKKCLLEELHMLECLGIQIDGSNDCHKLGIKFVTARMIKDEKVTTRFLRVIESYENDASGLLEALGRLEENDPDAFACPT